MKHPKVDGNKKWGVNCSKVHISEVSVDLW